MSQVRAIDVSQCTIRGGSLKNGYSRMWYKGKTLLGHRVAFIKECGEIPENIELHHICGNRQCINTNHLLPVTRQEHSKLHPEVNGIAKLHKEATHCKEGHLLDGKNQRQRFCSVCKRKSAREYLQRKREENYVVC